MALQTLWLGIEDSIGKSSKIFKYYIRKLIFSRTYNKIVDAMSLYDQNLISSQNAGWRGMVEYYESNGGLNDIWGDYPSR